MESSTTNANPVAWGFVVPIVVVSHRVVVALRKRAVRKLVTGYEDGSTRQSMSMEDASSWKHTVCWVALADHGGSAWAWLAGDDRTSHAVLFCLHRNMQLECI